jgi:hypothetical protein
MPRSEGAGEAAARHLVEGYLAVRLDYIDIDGRVDYVIKRDGQARTRDRLRT